MDNNGLILQTLLAPLTANQFIEEYWPCRHYETHGDPQRLAELYKYEGFRDIPALIRAHHTRARLHVIDKKGLYRCDLMVPPNEASVLYQSGVTVGIDNLDKGLPIVRKYLKQLARELSIPRKFGFCLGFASPAGKGVPKHFDSKEVFVIQISGRKRWHIFANENVDYPTENYAPSSPPEFAMGRELQLYWSGESCKEIPENAHVVEMKPGSVLFLPRGYWHATEALEDSFSLSFGFFTPTWLDLFLDQMRHRLIQHSTWRAPSTGAWKDDSQRNRTKQQLSALLENWLEDLGPLKAEDLLRD